MKGWAYEDEVLEGSYFKKGSSEEKDEIIVKIIIREEPNPDEN